MIAFSRTFAMPNRETFSVPPIGAFVQKYLAHASISVDPFARNRRWATHTNDLDPTTSAEYHTDAEEFLKSLAYFGVEADLVILDPPYSPRQISECYKGIGRNVTGADTQNAALYARVRRHIPLILKPDGVVLSFGWNTNGMGKKHGFEPIEILIVQHGGGHNDTLCMAEKRIA